jgi:3-phenylpropionate/trans-cinnamate dioxygenase ferredoxin component
MAFVTVARVSDLIPGKGVCVEANGKKLALFLSDGKYYAIDEFCTHRNAPLHEGVCYGPQVMCPWHNSLFDLATGAHRNPPAKTGVRAYPVQIVGDDVQVDV